MKYDTMDPIKTFEQIQPVNSFIFGYIRVSTLDQNPQRQEQLILQKYPNQIHAFFRDSASGKTLERPGIQELFSTLRNYDTVVVESFSIISRNTADLLNLLESFKQKNITLISLKENFDFNTSTGKLLFTLLAALAQMEREILLERQREGIALAKARGAYKGRKSIPIPQNFHTCLQMYLNRENNYRIKQFMIDTGLKRTQLFQFIKKIKKQKQEQEQTNI
jgi:DNA invertase Pin-like site-specific DNA recombinase